MSLGAVVLSCRSQNPRQIIIITHILACLINSKLVKQPLVVYWSKCIIYEKFQENLEKVFALIKKVIIDVKAVK